MFPSGLSVVRAEPLDEGTSKASSSLTIWFLRGAAGSSRGLTNDNVLATPGTVATVGGGLKYWWRGAPKPRARLGIALEARIVARWKGIGLDQAMHVSPAMAASVLVGFP